MSTIFPWLRDLAEAVRRGRLSQPEAIRQATAPQLLTRIDAMAIEECNQQIRTIALEDLPLAVLLAELNTQIARAQGRPDTLGNCLSLLGWVYREHDQLDAALGAYTEARQIFDQFAQFPQARAIVAEIWRDLGMIYQRRGQLSAAAQAYAALETIGNELGRPELQGEALNRQGLLKLEAGELEPAIHRFVQALERTFYPVVERVMATSLGNCGIAHQLLGQLDEAEHDYQAALSISQQIVAYNRRAGVEVAQGFVDEERVGRHLCDLGSLLLARGQYEAALSQLERALEYTKTHNDRAGAQRCADYLGSAYLSLARRRHGERTALLGQAHAQHRLALQLAEERGDQRAVAAHLLNLGNVYYEQQQPDEARRCYARAAQLANQHAIDDLIWRIDYVTGNLLADEGQPAAAYKRYQAAMQRTEAQRAALANLDLRARFWNERVALYKRATLTCLQLRHQGGLWLALTHSEQARTRYLADKLNLGRPGSEAEAIRAVIAGLAPQSAVLVFHVTEQATLALIVTGPRPTTGRAALDNDWQRSEDGQIHARRFDSFSLGALQSLLFAGAESNPDTPGYLSAYYHASTDAKLVWSEKALQATLQKAAEQLLAPIEQALAALKISRVIMMPNLGLSLLPLHACPLSADECMIDRYTVQYAPSFRILAHSQDLARRNLDQPPGLVAVSNPSQDLKLAEVEVRRISACFAPAAHKQILSGSPPDLATPQAVLAAAPSQAYLHFACHGTFQLSDVLQSALILAAEHPASAHLATPQPLTLARILDELRLDQSRLVVMSACETGMADPGSLADEYFSLSAGFLMAGAPTVLASLWAADNEATTLLMHNFYVRHLGEGKDPAVALREAQIWLRRLTIAAWAIYNDQFRTSDPRAYLALEGARQRHIGQQQSGDPALATQARPFADPYYWAAFSVVGA